MSNEEIMPVQVFPTDPVMERTENVALIRRRNEAVTYLRHQDCAMTTTLRDHLAENIRLHKILDGINAEIARLKQLLKTPKPKFKVGLVILAIIIAIGGMLLFSDRNAPMFYASLVIGIGLIVLAIVLKVKANKKWQAFIDETNAQLKTEEENAVNAQKDIDDYWNTHVTPFVEEIVPDLFPASHVFNYNAVCGILDIMTNLRADTIKEAVNLYEELMFRGRMQNAFKHMEASLAETARNSARTAEAAERSAAANESAAASAALTAASAASMAASSASMARSASRVADASVSASNASIDASNALRDAANRY